MAYRFKDPGHGPDNNRMDGDKLPRDDMDDLGHGPRPPFARGRRPSPGRDKSFSDRGRDFGGFGRDEMHLGLDRDRSPMRGRFDDRYSERDRFRRDELPYPRREELGRKDMSRSFMDDRDPFREKFMDTRGRFEQPGFGSRYDMLDDSFKSRPMNLPNKGGFYKNDMMKPNECEIIVVNKQQRAYGENIEARMKNLGIQVDILFLKDEALLVQTIDDIARRGCLYAMVISPLNETHGSVTLNILYGTPQEHRNMPLDDALKLVARNFHDHIRSQRELMDRDRSERGFYSGSFPADRELQFLFRLLVDGRQLSIGELETVIKHLNDRRDKMKTAQGEPPGSMSSSGPPMPSDVNPSNQKNINSDIDMAKKEQDLQNRIMDIMNQSSAGDMGNAAIGAQNKHGPGMNAPDMGGVRPPPVPSVGPGGNRPPMSGNPPGMGSIPSGPNQPNMSHEPPVPGRSGMNPGHPNMGSTSAGLPSGNQTPTSSTYINFDNPSVKKALDSLMQSGPGLLQSLSGTNTMTSQGMPDKNANKMQGNMSGPNPRSGMGEAGAQMGNMPHSTGGMGHMQNRNMGPPDNRNMGGPDNRGMGPPDGRGMGLPQGMGMNSRQGPNMGPAPGAMSNLGHRSGSPFQDRPGGMYGGNANMMGNRPHYMGMGGPMGNQGVGSAPRRY